MQISDILGPLALLPCIIAAPSHPASPNIVSRYSKATSYCPSKPANAAYQRYIFNQFVTALYTTKNITAAFDKFIDVNLIEHDPFDEQGRDANAAKLLQIIPFVSFEVLGQNFDNNIGFIHVRVNEKPQPIALADIYRMNGTCIVEHWDVTQAKPANATNLIAMF